MGCYIKTKCVCGAKDVTVDVFDHDDYAAEWGVTCSPACRSVWNTRVEWSAEFDYDYQMGTFGVSYPLPTFPTF